MKRTGSSMSLLALLLVACTDHVVPCETAVDASAPLVTRVSWDSDAEGTSSLAFAWAEDEGEGRVTDVSPTSHVASVVGIPPLTEVTFIATTTAGRRTWQCEGVFQTPNLGTEAPDVLVTVDVPERQSTERYLVGSILTGSRSDMVVLDRQGRLRWLLGDDEEHVVIMASPALGGGLLNTRHGRPQGFPDGELVWRDLAGDAVTSVSVAGSHHVFRELADGSVLYLKLDIRDAEVGGAVETVVGDSVVQRFPDGDEQVLFSTWDHLELRDEIASHVPFYPQGLDWVHGNGLFYVEATDTVLFSMADVRTVVEFERATGAVVRSFRGEDRWVIGGDDFTVAEGEPFRHQHDPHYDDDGNLVVFATDDGSSHTGARVYAVDEDTYELREVWSYVPDPAQLNWALGQVQELANGNRLIAFPMAGIVREVAPDGTVVWDLRTPLGTAFGQVYLRDELP
jgi:hypothetical protein